MDTQEKTNRRRQTLRWLVLPALLLAVELGWRLLGLGVPPAAYCPDGSPREGHAFAQRGHAPSELIQAPYILCFGDGWTYGVGVPLEQTWPAVLQETLVASGAKNRVLNFAGPTDTTSEVAGRLPGAFRTFHPSVAVVFVGAQDAVPLKLAAEFGLGAALEPKRCRRPVSFFGHWLGRQRLAFRLWRDDPDRPDNKEFLPRRGTVAATQRALLDIAQLADLSDVRVVFVTYPDLARRPTGPPFLPLESRYNFLIQGAANESGASLVDLRSRWGEHTPEYLLDWLIWPHPNAAGHADIAAAVAAAL
jgi:lysophospholipase L1-like esterase